MSDENPQKIAVSVRLPAELRDKVADLAVIERRSISAQIETMLSESIYARKALKDHKGDNSVKS